MVITPAQISLSRRAAIVSTSEAGRELSWEEHKRFVAAVASATGFEALAQKWQRVIERAEAELGRAIVDAQRM